MATDPQDDVPPAEGEVPPAAPPRKPLLVAAIAAAGLAAGGGLGMFVTGPLMAKKLVKAPAATHDTTTHADSAESAGPVHLLDNMVLNPAGTGGARFLLVTVALQARNEADLATLKGRDAAIRDVVLRVLGSCKVEQLSDVAQRDSLKARVLAEVDSLMRRPTVKAVFFPQFVIQ